MTIIAPQQSCQTHLIYYSACGHLFIATGNQHSRPSERNSNFPCNQHLAFTIDYEAEKCDTCSNRCEDDERKLSASFEVMGNTGIDTKSKCFERELARWSSYFVGVVTGNRRDEAKRVAIRERRMRERWIVG
jgi:hypothetical protein